MELCWWSSYSLRGFKSGVFCLILSRGRSVLVSTAKLLLLAAFVLPSLVPAGYMAHRSADSGQLEFALCPSAFSKASLSALSSAVSGSKGHSLQNDVAGHNHHHGHHSHHGHTTASAVPADSDPHAHHEAHHEDGASQECPLALPGVAITAPDAFPDIARIITATFQVLPATTAKMLPLLPPPGRGPPILS